MFDVGFVFKQKTADEVRISDWSSDVCSSDLGAAGQHDRLRQRDGRLGTGHGTLRQGYLGGEFAYDSDCCRLYDSRRCRIKVKPARLPERKNGRKWPKPGMRTTLRRSEERSVGKERVSTCKYRGGQFH